MKAAGRPLQRWIALRTLAGLIGLAPAALPAQGYLVVHNLTMEEGRFPISTLIQDSNGFFYGTATKGGIGGGTVFKVDASNDFHVIHTMEGPGGGEPLGLLLGQDGYLYGVTDSDGENNGGAIFRLDTEGNSFSVLHDFASATHAGHRSLVQDGAGTLYGLAGVADLFRIDPDGSNYSLIHAFLAGEGSPYSLILASDGWLYGTTAGTVFRLATDGEDFQTLHTLSGDEGGTSEAPLLEGNDGFLYGVALTGGLYSGGTAFKLRKDGTSFAVIHHFQEGDGLGPWAALTQTAGGMLYGTTNGAGVSGGTIFRMTTAGELFSPVHQFMEPTGHLPRGAVLQGPDGALYGTTYLGGPGGAGVVYRLSIPSITGLSPSSGPAEGGTLVTISGDGFQGGAAVRIGGALVGAVVTPDAITASSPPLPAGTLNDVSVANPGTSLAFSEKAWLADFLDVPQADPFHDFVEQIVRHGITSGCGGGNYCDGNPVSRAQMAVFLLKAKHGPNFVPPSCGGAFPDVACPSPFADWIEQLAAENITAGCSGGGYCPDNPVTRAQMAVFLLKTEHGAAYVPPPCAGIYDDVACPSPFADWIERLAAEDVTGGCGGNNYCPANPNTRGQMAVFLTKTFGLQ